MCCSFTVHTYLFDDGVTITKETFSSCHLLLSYGLMVNFRIVLQCFKVRSCQYQKFSFFVSCFLKAVLLSSPLDFFFFLKTSYLCASFVFQEDLLVLDMHPQTISWWLPGASVARGVSHTEGGNQLLSDGLVWWAICPTFAGSCRAQFL